MTALELTDKQLEQWGFEKNDERFSYKGYDVIGVNFLNYEGSGYVFQHLNSTFVDGPYHLVGTINTIDNLTSSLKGTIKLAAIEYVQADCGHEVDRDQVMIASMGTTCPDCYDKMSS